MASIVNDPNGRKRISFQAADGSWKTIRLGEVSDALAQDYLEMAKHLSACAAAPQLVAEKILEKAARMPVQIYDRFARAGLLSHREDALRPNRVTLGKFLEELFAQMRCKPATLVAYGHVRVNLEKYFTRIRPLQDDAGEDNFTDKEVDLFRAWLTDEKEGASLSPATAARRIIAARQFFKKAVRWGYMSANPFADSRGGSQKNLKRRYFVSREIIEKVLAACIDDQWRLIVALARYGGIRIPSELYTLTWSDIDWGRRQLTIHSPKTEHHEGKESRIVPLFPELETYLLRVHSMAEPGEDLVITRYRRGQANLRTTFRKIIKRAGVPVWPRLFQNLRASRETELFADYPIETACAWIGNSPTVAVTHYINDPEKDAHFQRATGREALGVREDPNESDAQSDAPTGGSGGLPEVEEALIGSENTVFDVKNGGGGGESMGAAGFENHAETKESEVLSKSDAQSDAHGPAEQLSELQELEALWPLLPSHIRRTILDLAQAAPKARQTALPPP